MRRIPKIFLIPQLVSAPLILYRLYNSLGGATQNVSTTFTDKAYVKKTNQSECNALNNELRVHVI